MSLAGMLLRVAFTIACLPGAGASAMAETDGELNRGREIYNFRCYYCHGYSGNAQTLASGFLQPPPADFTRADPGRLNVGEIAKTITTGRAGTAMKSFANVISSADIEAVARFVYDEFVIKKALNTRYHTEENGWPDHGRYQLAFPFATGEIPLSRPWEQLDAAQADGRRLYMNSCVSCHDRGSGGGDDTAWDARPLSYPRNNFSLSESPVLDAIAGASPYAKHDRVPNVENLTVSEKRGQDLFQQNCAFCHGADGTGKNWIGQFLEPHPRNLQDPLFMTNMTRERLQQSISEGLPGTSMPSWKSVLSRGQMRDIVNYIGRAFFPLAKWKSGGQVSKN